MKNDSVNLKIILKSFNRKLKIYCIKIIINLIFKNLLTY